ncbi:MAG: hypothetical protein WC071_06750, partial [Victivallaceae bacterium]
MSNRKVVFLEVNSSYSHSMLSYCLIRAYTEQEVPEWSWGHVETTLKGSVPDTLDELLKQAPDVLLATAYVFNLDFLREVFSRYKRLCPAVKIILGGPSFLGDNRSFLLANQFVSAVVRGDESSVPALLRQQGNSLPETIPGLCWIAADDKYFDNGIAAFAEDFDALPSPCDKPYIHQDKPFYQLETSRGCGAQCVFCTSSCSPGVKYFSLERVRNDLTALKTKGFREIRLIDRTFNEDTERAVNMLRMFYDEFPEMKFHLEIHPARLKPELVDCLKQAPHGQLHVEAGVQSFCP